MLDRTRGLARAEGDPKGPSQGDTVADFDIAARVALIDPLAALALRAANVIRQSGCDGLRRKAGERVSGDDRL